MTEAQLVFEQRLLASWPGAAWHDVTVLIAVSGGADSVALLTALHRLKTGGQGRLVVAHFNHHLRGEESSADEQFVTCLADRLAVECVVGHGSPHDQPVGGQGLESQARDLRYDFLRSSAERLGARYIATAHTADDQAETVVHRIVRGTGLAGLAGIRRARPLGECTTLIRPMLEIRRTAVREYLDLRGQPYREDSSNALVQFTRNRIRQQLLPLLVDQYNPAVVEALLRLAKLAADAQEVIDSLVTSLLEQAVRPSAHDVLQINCRVLAGQPRHLVREVLIAAWRRRNWPEQSMGLHQWDKLADYVALSNVAAPPGFTLPGSVRVHRQGFQCHLVRQLQNEA